MSRLTGGLKTLLLLTLLIIAATTVGVRSEPSPADGVISGQVSDSGSGEPLAGASVALVDHYGGAVADNAGKFLLRKLAPGLYSLRISQVGYETGFVDSLHIQAGDTLYVNCLLARKPIKLSGITVAPGTYGIMDQAPTTSTGLSRDEMETMPHFGEDLYRAIKRLPGVSSGEYSTRFQVRGGDYDEVLVTLDGLRLYEPFHLKDVDGGALSIIDVGAVDDVKLMTGGFGAKYGDAMSGVLTIDSRRPERKAPRYTAGLSLFNARLLADGFYADGRGEWLVALRRGYFDLALDLANEDDEISPTYYDVFAKTRYQLSDNEIIGVHLLHAGDALEFFYTDNDADSLWSDWNNSYVWLTLHSQLSEGLTAFTVAGLGDFDHSRRGQGFDAWRERPQYRVDDREDCRMRTVRTDWQWEAGERLMLSWGGEYRFLATDFDYTVGELVYYVFPPGIDTTRYALTRWGERYGAYLTGRWKPVRPLTADLGVRYDRATHTGGEHLAPRANLRVDLTHNASLRLGWGYFYQSQDVSDLQVIDGDTRYNPDERAEHFVAGFEWGPHPGYTLRLDGFYKRYRDPSPEYRNLYEALTFFPEAEWDRAYVIRSDADARGLELFFSKDNGGKLAWWLSYALARSEDDISRIVYQGDSRDFQGTVPSLQDQEHTLSVDLAYRPTSRWQINVAYNFHTGWPYTNRVLTMDFDSLGRPTGYTIGPEYWNSRVGDYHRTDLRINRFFSLSHGRLTAFVEVINIFDRDNVRRYDSDLVWTKTTYVLVPKPLYWFGRLPSFGVTYSWNF